MPKKVKKDKTAVIYARIPLNLKRTLEKSASKHGRELSGQVKYILQCWYSYDGQD